MRSISRRFSAKCRHFCEWLPRVAPVRLAENRRRTCADSSATSGCISCTRTCSRRRSRRRRSRREIRIGSGAAAVCRAGGDRGGGAARSTAQRQRQARCPFCNALPVVGVLREAGHGAKRTLVCALCLVEREYLRVVCPSCGEQQFDALPVYTADNPNTSASKRATTATAISRRST